MATETCEIKVPCRKLHTCNANDCMQGKQTLESVCLWRFAYPNLYGRQFLDVCFDCNKLFETK